MALSVEEGLSGVITSNSDTVEVCTGYILIPVSDYLEYLSSNSLGLPPLTSSDVLVLASSTLLFWATCYVFNYLQNAT